MDRTDAAKNPIGAKTLVLDANGDIGQVPNVGNIMAWVSFNGTGTKQIYGSGNVLSITANGTGRYLINFINPMPDTNYAVLAMSNVGGIIDAPGASDAIKTVNQVGVNTRTNTGALADASHVSVLIVR